MLLYLCRRCGRLPHSHRDAFACTQTIVKQELQRLMCPFETPQNSHCCSGLELETLLETSQPMLHICRRCGRLQHWHCCMIAGTHKFVVQGHQGPVSRVRTPRNLHSGIAVVLMTMMTTSQQAAVSLPRMSTTALITLLCYRVHTNYSRARQSKTSVLS